MATNIRFKGLVKTTAELESDKFAGRIGWNSTLARFVAYYSSTLYAQMARRDVLETFAAGIQDSTLGVGLPMFGGAGGRLSTESVASFRTRIGAVNIAGDAMTGGLTLSAGNLNVNAGNIQTAGVTRISSGGAGTLTTLSTTGTATLQSVNISGLTGARMLSLDASKNVVSLDAAGSRALIGAASSAGSVSYATLFTGRRTVTGLTNGVTGTLIPSYTVAANGWSVGMRLLFEFNLFTARDGQVEVKIGGNTIASYGLGTVTRSIFRIELVCLSTGATARFAYAASAYDPATSTATTQTIIGDSQASVDSVGDNWSVDTTASTSIAFEYTPSTGSQNVVVHSASVQTCTP